MERREVFEDAMVNLAKKEKDRSKALRKRNNNRLTDILDRMTNIKYNTTWEQAQAMLLDNPAFADDDDLLAMDKEDALIVFPFESGACSGAVGTPAPPWSREESVP